MKSENPSFHLYRAGHGMLGLIAGTRTIVRRRAR